MYGFKFAVLVAVYVSMVLLEIKLSFIAKLLHCDSTFILLQPHVHWYGTVVGCRYSNCVANHQ